MTDARRRGVTLLMVIAAVATLIGATWYAWLPPNRHDLAETGATVVVRDGGHIELRLQVPWADVLHGVWIPAVPLEEFLVRATSRPVAEFARELAKVESDVERGARLVPDGGATARFTRWQWPRANEVQEALRRELMSRLADKANFEHASRLPASAELAVGRELTSVQLQLPVVLGPALLTVYRPAEQWLAPGALSPPMGVRRLPPP